MDWGITMLSPSDIHYTQSSIGNRFKGQLSGHYIGWTLDDLCEKRCWVKDIKCIQVFKRRYWSEERWWSSDNRRLWVLKEFQRLGGCRTIPVKVIPFRKMNRQKFTTTNGGTIVEIRGGDPGGKWYKKPDNVLQKPVYMQAKFLAERVQFYPGGVLYQRRQYLHYSIDETEDYSEDDSDDGSEEETENETENSRVKMGNTGHDVVGLFWRGMTRIVKAVVFTALALTVGVIGLTVAVILLAVFAEKASNWRV